MRIVVVEDDVALSRGISLALNAPDKVFTLCADLNSARNALNAGDADLLIAVGWPSFSR
jgi:DNA-binding response OmpR family regulator